MILVSGLKGRYCIQDLRERFIEKMEKQLAHFIFSVPPQCDFLISKLRGVIWKLDN